MKHIKLFESFDKDENDKEFKIDKEKIKGINPSLTHRPPYSYGEFKIDKDRSLPPIPSLSDADEIKIDKDKLDKANIGPGPLRVKGEIKIDKKKLKGIKKTTPVEDFLNYLDNKHKINNK